MLEKKQRVDFTCPHCTALVHATTLRDFRGSQATQLTLGNQALRAHLASCPKKPETAFRQEATDRAK